jgi:hypothetical protein
MKELIAHLGEIHHAIINRTADLRFDRSQPQHLYCVSLHGTVLETAAACLTLLKANKCAAVPALLRRRLEAYIDSVNLSRCSEYIFTMQAAFLKEQSRILKAAGESGGRNPYLEALLAEDGLEEHIQKVTSELQGLQERRLGPLTIKERFEKAGLTEMYQSVYALLCMHSHNNLNILERRHLEISNDDCRVAYFKRWDKDSVLPYIDTIAGVIVDSLRHVAALLNVKQDINVEGVEERLASLRSRY